MTNGTDLAPVAGVGADANFSLDGERLYFADSAHVGVIDLGTGRTASVPCTDCSGIAVADGRVVSVDPGFNLHVFDLALGSQRVLRVDHVPDPHPEEPYPQEPVTPTVMGALAGRIAMKYPLTTGIVRGGPNVVSLYRLDGSMQQSWAVDGRIDSWQVDATGSRLVLRAGGSGGACASISSPFVIDPTARQPIVLLPSSETADQNVTYISSDVWWNGPEVVTFGDFEHWQPECKLDPVFRRFNLHGQLEATPTDNVIAYRFLGAGCDRALVEHSTDHNSTLEDFDGSTRHVLLGYDTILWTAERATACSKFPGIGR